MSSVCYNLVFKMIVDFCTTPCYPICMKLKDLNHFNQNKRNAHQLSLAGSMSYPTVAKYLSGEVHEPSAVQIAKLLSAMGIKWQDVKLGDILEDNHAS